MDYLVLLGCLVLTAVFALYVAYPLLTRRAPAHGPLSGADPHHLVEHKEQLYASIKEVESDRALGKLSSGDYQRLRAELEDQALEVLGQLDQLDDPATTEALLARIEVDVRALEGVPQANAFCGSCGAQQRAEDRFCPQCGTRFEAAG